jgi:hypothetical protein
VLSQVVDTDRPKRRFGLAQAWVLACAVVITLVVAILLLLGRDRDVAHTPAIDYTRPVRAEPEHFTRRTRMPVRREIDASGANVLSSFDAGRDLVKLYDSRVWWESDNDGDGDDEDDHAINRALETPLRRVIELVAAAGGRLKVQDSYRASGVHCSTSLHKEGRAVDLTAEVISLEKLAKLCWAAGFHWVFYEVKGGEHIHCSVQPMGVGSDDR